MRRAVDDERRARQRLEGGCDIAVAIVVVRPGQAPAQCQDRVWHRPGIVGAQAKFAARCRDALRSVSQRECICSRQSLLRIGRQIEGGELPGRVRRDPHPWRSEAIAALDAAGEGVGIELRVQAIDAGDGHGTVGGDVLPAIGKRAGDIGRSDFVLDEGPGLKQVGASGAAVGNAELGTPAGEREPGDRARREDIIRAGRHAEHPAGGVIRSQRHVAVGGLRTAEASGPHAPARVEHRIARHRLGDHAVGIAFAAAPALAAGGGVGLRSVVFLRKRCRARCRCRTIAASADKGIEQRGDELRHRVEGGLLRSGSGFAGGLGETRGAQCREYQRNAACRVEGISQCVCDIPLIVVQAGQLRHCEVEVEVGVIRVIAQAGRKRERQISAYQQTEGAVDAADSVDDGILLRDIGTRRKGRVDRRAAERGRARHVGAVRRRRRDLDHVTRCRREHQAALHRQRADRIAGRQPAAIDRGVADNAVAAKRAAGVHRCQRG